MAFNARVMKKKILLGILVGLVVVLVAAVVLVGVFMDSIVKKAVETVGPQLTKVEIKLDGVSLSPLSGSGQLKGLFVGNPEGFKTPSAIKVASVKVAVDPGSLLSDKIIVKEINVQAPEITYEGPINTKNCNLNKILANLEEATGGSGDQPADKNKPAGDKEASAQKKLQVNDFVVTGAKLNLNVSSLGGKTMTVDLPDIHFKDLGTGTNGITAGELAKKFMGEVTGNVAKIVPQAIANIGKGALDLGKEGVNQLDKAAKGIKGLFKK